MLRNRDFVASDISTPAATKRLSNYEQFIEEFEEESWTYIPMPEDGKYYNIKTEEGPKNLVEEQLIESDLHLLDAMELLCNQPFLLILTAKTISTLVYNLAHGQSGQRLS